MDEITIFNAVTASSLAKNIQILNSKSFKILVEMLLCAKFSRHSK